MGILREGGGIALTRKQSQGKQSLLLKTNLLGLGVRWDR